MRDREGITRLLAEAPMSIDARDEFGMTALHWAVAQNYEELVQDLLNNYKLDLNVQDNEGNTPLHYAARNGNDVIFQVLLAHGANINTRNNGGNTALHLAAQAGRLAIVRSFLRHDSATIDSINRVNNRGLSAWLLARRHNHHDSARELEPMAGQALLNLLLTEGQQGYLGVFSPEIAAHIARFVVAQRLCAQVRSNSNSNS